MNTEPPSPCTRCGRIRRVFIVPSEQDDGRILLFPICEPCRDRWENPRGRFVQMLRDIIHRL